ncbi:hypothetical protein [Puia sp.]|uniref:hypothetical protein n=1 Tax=Puia sp. TaxID=2045100 RepID=UPI002F41115E
MSPKLSLLFLSIAFVFIGCKKSSTSSSSEIPTPIAEAQAFFNREIVGVGKGANAKNYRAKQPKSVDWKRATVRHLSSGDVVVAPIAYKNDLLVTFDEATERAYDLSDLTSLVITQDKGKTRHAYMVTFIPDTTININSMTGVYLVEDWQGNSVQTPFHRKPSSNTGGDPVSGSSGAKQIDIIQTIQVCSEIVGYNYSPDFPDESFSWSETTCTTFGFSSDPGLPSGGLPSLGIVPTRQFKSVVVPPPGNPIASISDYFHCFTDGPSPDHSYSVQVCVDQSDPGTRLPWGFTPGGPVGSSSASNFVNVGHVFLILTENDQGNITSRNVGFYPTSMVVPTTSGAFSQGVLNNDQSHTYNINLTVNVSSSQFFSILNYVSLGNNTGYLYNLNSNNCTTFAINAMAAGGVTLPSTKGSWPGGAGNDPGDLGEDIRNMPLSSNMTRNTVENSHPNVGSCN